MTEEKEMTMEATTLPRKRGRPKKVIDVSEPEAPADISRRKKSTATKKAPKSTRNSPEATSAKTISQASTKAEQKLNKPVSTASALRVKQSKILQEVTALHKVTEQANTNSASLSSSTSTKLFTKPGAETSPGAVPPTASATNTPESESPIARKPMDVLPSSSLNAQAQHPPMKTDTRPEDVTLPPLSSPSATATKKPASPLVTKPLNASNISPSGAHPYLFTTSNRTRSIPSNAPKPSNAYAAPSQGSPGQTPPRPASRSKGHLPPNYKSVARKVTLSMVALPIAIVTSWELYDRRK